MAIFPRDREGADSTFSLWLAPGHCAFLEGVCAYVWHLDFCGCHPEDALFECLALVANGAHACRSQKMWQTNKHLTGYQPPPHSTPYPPRAQCWSWEKCSPPSLPLSSYCLAHFALLVVSKPLWLSEPPLFLVALSRWCFAKTCQCPGGTDILIQEA